jgi:hypothetical protein
MKKSCSIIIFMTLSILVTDNIAQSKKTEEKHPILNTVSKATTQQTNDIRFIFYDQTGGATTNGYASQDFETMYDSFDCQAADDFSAVNGCILNKVDVIGSYFTVGPADGFNVYFYTDSGGIPGTQVYYAFSQPYTFDGVNLFTISLDSFAVLPPGNYWVSVQCRMDFSTGGQWYWHQVNGAYSNTAQWQNPEGGWLTGCTTWGPIQDCINAVGTDMAFALHGVVVPVELISFGASTSTGEIVLNWETATETNNSGFEIQRSINNNTLTKIAFIKGYGTTTEVHNYSYTDKNIKPGKYQYRLKQIDLNGEYNYSKIIEVNLESPAEFILEQNYPNPFNPGTKISWKSPVGCWQLLRIYDVLGNLVTTLVDEYRPAGRYEVEFEPTADNHQLAGGVYIYRLQTGSFIDTKKMILLK